MPPQEILCDAGGDPHGQDLDRIPRLMRIQRGGLNLAMPEQLRDLGQAPAQRRGAAGVDGSYNLLCWRGKSAGNRMGLVRMGRAP